MWAPAIFGLVGVVVGAVVTGGVDLVLEKLRERTERRRMRRLIAGELQTLWVQLDVAVAEGVTPRVPISDYLPDDVWLSSRPLLASAVDRQEARPGEGSLLNDVSHCRRMRIVFLAATVIRRVRGVGGGGIGVAPGHRPCL